MYQLFISYKKDVGIAIFNLNPRVDSSLETDLINHYFKGSGSNFKISTDQWLNYNSALQSGNNSYYDQGIGRVPTKPPANGSIDSYDFNPFYSSGRTPANNIMNMVAYILGPILGGNNFYIYAPSSSNSVAPSPSSSAANVGYVLYPNISNMNQMQNVYHK